MTEQKLRDLLEQLHEELKRTTSVDEKGRELLGHVNEDMKKFLDPTQKNPDALLDRLQKAIDHFEVDHPAITAALSQMLNALSNAGI